MPVEILHRDDEVAVEIEVGEAAQEHGGQRSQFVIGEGESLKQGEDARVG